VSHGKLRLAIYRAHKSCLFVPATPRKTRAPPPGWQKLSSAFATALRPDSSGFGKIRSDARCVTATLKRRQLACHERGEWDERADLASAIWTGTLHLPTLPLRVAGIPRSATPKSSKPPPARRSGKQLISSETVEPTILITDPPARLLLIKLSTDADVRLMHAFRRSSSIDDISDVRDADLHLPRPRLSRFSSLLPIRLPFADFHDENLASGQRDVTCSLFRTTLLAECSLEEEAVGRTAAFSPLNWTTSRPAMFQTDRLNSGPVYKANRSRMFAANAAAAAAERLREQERETEQRFRSRFIPAR